MNVVVIDSDHLAGEAEFPMLDLPKFGWQQYPQSPAEELPDLCWRSDLIVTVSTPVDQTVIDKAFKLKLIAVAGEASGHVDLAAAQARGIKVCNVPGRSPDQAGDSVAICHEVVENINAFLRDEARNLVE